MLWVNVGLDRQLAVLRVHKAGSAGQRGLQGEGGRGRGSSYRLAGNSCCKLLTSQWASSVGEEIFQEEVNLQLRVRL